MVLPGRGMKDCPEERPLRRAQEDCAWRGREKGTAAKAAVQASERLRRQDLLGCLVSEGWWEIKMGREDRPEDEGLRMSD